MENLFFTLDENKNVIPCKDVMEWATMFENFDRVVAQDEIGGLRISTVFFGTNMNPISEPPLVFETMVFRNGESIDCWRYATWNQALKKHNEIIGKIKSGKYKERS